MEIQGLTGLERRDCMIKLLFEVIFKMITALLNVVLLPLNLLIANAFPNLNSMISTFNTTASTVLGSGMGFFASLIPPITRSMILLYLTLLVAFYTISIASYVIIKVFTIIRNIKFW